MTLKIVIMGSTKGSSIHSLMQYIDDGKINAKIVLVASDKPDSLILEKAKILNIPTYSLPANGLNRQQYDSKMMGKIDNYFPDVILMVGYMRIVSSLFAKHYKNKLLNIHPSLLPKHSGLMDLAVHQSVLNANDKKTGCTIHRVIKDVDMGQSILQLECSVNATDTAQDLKVKVQALESRAWIDIIKNWKGL